MSPQATEVRVGDIWHDEDGAPQRVIALKDGWAYVRSAHATRGPSIQTNMAWFDYWTLSRRAEEARS